MWRLLGTDKGTEAVMEGHLWGGGGDGAGDWMAVETHHAKRKGKMMGHRDWRAGDIP